MIIKDELIKIEVEKMLNEKINECMTKIINDFNDEKHGAEIETIKMENIHYVISINNEKIIL